MRELAQIRIRYGNLCLHVLLRRGGWTLGKDQTYRLYTEESLQLRSKRPRRRKMAVARRERYVPKRPNQAWSMDFVVGQLLRAEHIVEACNRLVSTRGSPVLIGKSRGHKPDSPQTQFKPRRWPRHRRDRDIDENLEVERVMGIEPMLVDWDKRKQWPLPGSCRCVLEGPLLAGCWRSRTGAS